MKHELTAYLIQGDGDVSALPTEGILVAFDQLLRVNEAQEHPLPSTQAAVSGVLQAIRQAMRQSTSLDPERHWWE